MLADTPLDQGIQCYCFDRPWKSGTVNVLFVYKYLRLGDVIRLMMDRERFMCVPGLGPTKYMRLKDGLKEHGWPVDDILPSEKKRR